MEFKSLASVLLIGIILTGCGGGGGGGDSGGGNNSSTAPTAEPTTPVADTTCATTLAGIFNDLLVETNAVRTTNGASSLRFSYQLGQAAQDHAEDMATNNYFSHTSLSGATIADRIEASDYVYHSAGENIAAGQQSVEEVVQAWFDSPSHKDNLLNPDYVDVGFGFFVDDDSKYGSYWVQEFGEPTDETTVDTRAYNPTNCSVGTIASDDTNVLSGTLGGEIPATVDESSDKLPTVSSSIYIFNDQDTLAVPIVLTSHRDEPNDQDTLAVPIVLTSHRDEPVDTPEPAMVLSLCSIAMGLGFSRKIDKPRT